MEKLDDTLQNACKEFEEDLVLHYYGEGSAAERQRVESHLVGCSLCRGFSDDLSRLLPQMAKPTELPPSFWDKYYREVIDKLAEQQERGPWWRVLFAPIQGWAVPAFGTAVVLVLGLALTLGNVAWNPFEEPNQGTIPQEILSDPNRVEFFKSMELVESLRRLEAMEGSNIERRNTPSARPI
jgi:predicted anti-sigma-YlaC factor YlaD